MFAVIKTGGKQYRVAAEDTITVMTLEGQPGDKVTFGDVMMLVDGEATKIGAPFLSGASVAGEIVDPSQYYFRTTPRIETSAEKYAWMNRRLFVCWAARLPDRVQIRYYKIT